MRNWLISSIGGISFEECQLRVDLARGNYLEERSYFTELLHEKDDEIRRLTDLMLSRAGYIVPERAQESQRSPIAMRESWHDKQMRLTKEDADRAANVRMKEVEKKNATQDS